MIRISPPTGKGSLHEMPMEVIHINLQYMKVCSGYNERHISYYGSCSKKILKSLVLFLIKQIVQMGNMSSRVEACKTITRYRCTSW